MERRILEAVARADLILSAVLRALPAVAALTALLILAVIVARARLPDPYQVDYDRPGVDVTSEGPEGYTSEYYKWE